MTGLGWAGLTELQGTSHGMPWDAVQEGERQHERERERGSPILHGAMRNGVLSSLLDSPTNPTRVVSDLIRFDST